MAKWYYVENGKAVGPVEESFIQDGLKSGRFNLTNLVFREGSAIWKTVGETLEFGMTPSAGPPPAAPPEWILLKRKTPAQIKADQAAGIVGPERFIQLGPYTTE